MATAKEFRDQTSVELESVLLEKRQELFSLGNKFAREKKNDGQGKLRVFKKDIARILTILREKELAK